VQRARFPLGHLQRLPGSLESGIEPAGIALRHRLPDQP